MIHELKIEKQYYERVEDGTKTFEIRLNDRGYQKGDIVKLKRWDGELSDCLQQSSSVITKQIGYVCSYEQRPGYVVFSLLDM